VAKNNCIKTVGTLGTADEITAIRSRIESDVRRTKRDGRMRSPGRCSFLCRGDKRWKITVSSKKSVGVPPRGYCPTGR